MLPAVTLMILCTMWLCADAPAANPEESVLKLDEISLGFPEADEAIVVDWVEKLGDFDFQEREKASQALRELGPPAFPCMARAYRENDDFETRLRIEQIVRHQFLWHTLFKHRGFLGIGYEEVPANPRRPEGNVMIRITRVEPDTAAWDAGLRVGDFIHSIDGESLGGAVSRLDFRDIIQERGAGGQVTLGIYRGRRNVEFHVRLKARPLRYYADPTDPTLFDDLTRQMQVLSLWWAKYFSLPEKKRDQTPSAVEFGLPK
jgi:hypothetical protein